MESEFGESGFGINRLDSQLDFLGKQTPAQAQMLKVLAAIGGETTAAQVAKHLNLHVNSARELIDNLVDKKLVAKRSRHGSGRGRPATVYELLVPGNLHSFYYQLADFVTATVENILETAPTPFTQVKRVGERWAELYLRRNGFRIEEGDPEYLSLERRTENISRLRVLLSGQGFTSRPGAQANLINLSSCPYLVSDSRLQSLICVLHEAVIAKIVSQLSAGSASVQVCPFAHKNCCAVSLCSVKKKSRK